MAPLTLCPHPQHQEGGWDACPKCSDAPEAELELPWAVAGHGLGTYNDSLRIESTIERPHPQSLYLNVPMVTRSRIAHVVETRSGQGARTAQFILRAANNHHALLRALRELDEWCDNNVPYYAERGHDSRPIAEKVARVMAAARGIPSSNLSTSPKETSK